MRMAAPASGQLCHTSPRLSSSPKWACHGCLNAPLESPTRLPSKKSLCPSRLPSEEPLAGLSAGAPRSVGDLKRGEPGQIYQEVSKLGRGCSFDPPVTSKLPIPAEADWKEVTQCRGTGDGQSPLRVSGLEEPSTYWWKKLVLGEQGPAAGDVPGGCSSNIRFPAPESSTMAESRPIWPGMCIERLPARSGLSLPGQDARVSPSRGGRGTHTWTNCYPLTRRAISQSLAWTFLCMGTSCSPVRRAAW